MAGVVETAVYLWRGWGLQVLVLLSFTLQVTLLILAEFRRRVDSGALRGVVWVAYLSADSVAMYTLGHMSVNSGLPEQQLVAFWAPFLLLHLGGQDTITAYALEDNRLWMRHLQSFAVQVAAAGYVLYESSASIVVAGNGNHQSTLLWWATVLMFVVGALKYGERVWALKCANAGAGDDDNSRLVRGMDVIPGQRKSRRARGQSSDGDAEGLLLEAHLLFDICKRLIKGPGVAVAFREDQRYGEEELFKLIEMQLSLMHEVLYAKAEVIHTWYGYCTRAVSLLGTAAACWLFHFHQQLASATGDSSKVNVSITYILLLGASILEIISALRALCSGWTWALLCRRECCCLLHVVASLRRLVRPERDTRRWTLFMGQLNMFRMCDARSSKDEYSRRRSKVVAWMGLQDWWNTRRHSWFISIPAAVMRTVATNLDGEVGRHRGRVTLRRWGLFEELGWSVGNEDDGDQASSFASSILLWHIATDVYLKLYRKEIDQDEGQRALVEAINTLANYMFFLLVVRPQMLPGSVEQQQQYAPVLADLTRFFQSWSADEVATKLRAVELGKTDLLAGTFWATFWLSVSRIVRGMIGRKLSTFDTLQMIAALWVEFLCYVACESQTHDSHLKQLCNRAEVSTVVQLFISYYKMDALLNHNPSATNAAHETSNDYTTNV